MYIGNIVCIKCKKRPDKNHFNLPKKRKVEEGNCTKMLEILKKFDLLIYSGRNLMYNTLTIIHF